MEKHDHGFIKKGQKLLERSVETLYFYIDKIDKDSLSQINKSDFILVRQFIPEDILKNIHVPIIVFNERLYLPNYEKSFSSHYRFSIKHMLKKKNLIFLTDKIYENHKKKIFSYNGLWIDCFPLNSKKNIKDIDLLFLSGHNNHSKSFKVKNFSEININNFDNIILAMEKYYSKNLSFREKLLKLKFYKNEFSFDYFYNSSLNNLRFIRKQKNLHSINTLNKNYKIRYYGDNSNDEVFIKNHGLLEYENFDNIFDRSKIIICTSPCHMSIINERFIIALEHNIIPLVEPYPQYKKLNLPEEFFFDYKNENLSTKVDNILKNYSKYFEVYLDFKKNLNKIIKKDTIFILDEFRLKSEYIKNNYL